MTSSELFLWFSAIIAAVTAMATLGPFLSGVLSHRQDKRLELRIATLRARQRASGPLNEHDVADLVSKVSVARYTGSVLLRTVLDEILADAAAHSRTTSELIPSEPSKKPKDEDSASSSANTKSDSQVTTDEPSLSNYPSNIVKGESSRAAKTAASRGNATIGSSDPGDAPRVVGLNVAPGGGTTSIEPGSEGPDIQAYYSAVFELTDLILNQRQSDPIQLPPRISAGTFDSVEDADAAIQTGLSDEMIEAGNRAIEAVTNALNDGFTKEARSHFENALTDGDVPARTLVILARLASDARMGDLAAKLYLHASHLEPSDASIRRNLVVVLSKFGQDAIAVPYARQLVEQEPDNEDYADLYAQVLNNSDRHVEAHNFAEHALELFPNSIWLFQFWLESAKVLEVTEEETDRFASAFLYRISEQAPSVLGRAHAIYANILAREGRDSEAIAHYELAFSAGESSPITRGNYAIELTAVGRIDEAILHHEKALSTAEDQGDFNKIQRQFVRCLLSRNNRRDAARIRARKFDDNVATSGSVRTIRAIVIRGNEGSVPRHRHTDPSSADSG